MQVFVITNSIWIMIKVYVIQIWSSSNCECECDKSCDIWQYLDYESCKYRKKLIDALVDVVKILMEIKWLITIMKMYTILAQYT